MEMAIRRWETKDRYYETRVYIDLFGMWVLEVVNGGVGNRLGQCRTVAVGADIATAVEAIAKKRLLRGYAEIRVVGRATPRPELAENGRIIDAPQRVCRDQVRRPRRKLVNGIVKDPVVVNANSVAQFAD